jgi:hypothetical protein
VAEGWGIEVEGYAMFQLYSRLKAVKGILKTKNDEIFGGLGQKVIRAMQDLAMALTSFLNSHGSREWYVKEKECLHVYLSLVAAEENFLKQKSRNNWLNLGDGNSAFFHKVVKVHNATNIVKMLRNENGDSVYEPKQIKEMAVSFYKNLFG